MLNVDLIYRAATRRHRSLAKMTGAWHISRADSEAGELGSADGEGRIHGFPVVSQGEAPTMLALRRLILVKKLDN